MFALKTTQRRIPYAPPPCSHLGHLEFSTAWDTRINAFACGTWIPGFWSNTCMNCVWLSCGIKIGNQVFQIFKSGAAAQYFPCFFLSLGESFSPNIYTIFHFLTWHKFELTHQEFIETNVFWSQAADCNFTRVFGYESFNTIQSHIIPIGYDFYHQLVGKNIGKNHVENFYSPTFYHIFGGGFQWKTRPWYQLSAHGFFDVHRKTLRRCDRNGLRCCAFSAWGNWCLGWATHGDRWRMVGTGGSRSRGWLEKGVLFFGMVGRYRGVCGHNHRKTSDVFLYFRAVPILFHAFARSSHVLW